MRTVLFSILYILIFTSCSSHSDNSYYERANKASEKALDKLQRD